MILGTAAYMSPEQARGLAVDKRADMWAFGCVVYEMLTGHVAFPGDTLSDVIVSVLDRDPAWAVLPAETPAAMTRLLRRCLEKHPRRRLRDIGDARLELEESMTPVTALASGVGLVRLRREIIFQRLTDFAGMKESPAVSPDGKMVAFVAMGGGKRQIFVRFLAGGAELQLTRDNVDHEQPRWTPESNTLVYFTPAGTRGEDGTLWEISALGGWPRRLAAAMGGGDVSHDGRRIALFQLAGEQLALMTVARDGSHAVRVALLPAAAYSRPRWSPDDHEITFERTSNTAFDVALDIVPAAGGDRQLVTRSALIPGHCWLPDGSGLVYSSSRGSTVHYPPLLNLRTTGRRGEGDSAPTFGDVSYIEPDVHDSGRLHATRIRSWSDIWKIPVDGSPAENVQAAIRITRQTGHVRTRSVSPDGAEVVYIRILGDTATCGLRGRTSRAPSRSRSRQIQLWLPGCRSGRRVAIGSCS
jgi:dipeptidyl aminopeptidase/acylaminoacyl peptidase